MQRGVNRKWFFVCALLLLVVGVVAYNSAGVPSTFGHSANELEGVCKSDGTGCPVGLGGGGGIQYKPISSEITIVNTGVFTTNAYASFQTISLASYIAEPASAAVINVCQVLDQNGGIRVSVRSDASSGAQTVLDLTWASGSVAIDCNQVIVPLAADKSFQYAIPFLTANANYGNHVKFHLQGYLTAPSSGGGSGGTLETVSKKVTTFNSWATAQCDSGYVVTGCNCEYADPANSGPFYRGYCEVASATACRGKSSQEYTSYLYSVEAICGKVTGSGGTGNLLTSGKPRAIVCNTEVQYLEVMDTLGTRYRAFDGSYTTFNADGSFSQNLMGANCPAMALSAQTVLQ